jgi:predicted RNA-binding protein with PUA-like domain
MLIFVKIFIMNYWLVKSEPSTYSWEQFVKDKKTNGMVCETMQREFIYGQ